MKKRTAGLLVLGTLCIGLFVGSWMPEDDTLFTIRKNFTIFGHLYEEVATEYVDPVDPKRLMRTGIKAMLRTLDPYTVFIDESENEDIDIITEGAYGGVGLSIGMRNDRMTIISPIEGYSGYKQGVRTGDVLTHIDSAATKDLSMQDVRNLLRGEPGTTVTIQVKRPGEPNLLSFTLTRARVRLKNVTYAGFVEQDSTAGIGYVRLERFSRKAPQEVHDAIDSLRHETSLKGLILDLRDNPGGLLESAVNITDLFVAEGNVVVSTRGRDEETQQVYHSPYTPLLPKTPLVLLVNGSSASASEIVAGALQDLDRGVILGERTFGKGLVQVIKSLPYNTSLKITVSKYYTPSGRSIQSINYLHNNKDGGAVKVPDSLRKTFTTENGREVRGGGGIEPDIKVKDVAKSDLEKALLRKSAFFLYANHYTATHDSLPTPFVVTDTLFQAFRHWLSQQEFTYKTPTEQTIATLDEQLSDNRYAEATDELQALRQAITAEQTTDFGRYSDRLKLQLQHQIVARYKSPTAQIEASLAVDPQLQEALTLLENPKRYANVLDPR